MSSIVIAGDTSGSVTLQAPAVAGSTVITLPSTSTTLVSSQWTTSGANIFYNTGSVGVGAAPDSTFYVGGGALGTVRFFYNGTSINYNDVDTQIWRTAAATELARLTSTGLGIGTSSPAFKLDVNGAVRSTDFRAPTSSTFFLTGDNFKWRSTGGTDYMVLDGSGNLGLGVTPSAWRSNYKSIQFSSSSAVYGETGNTYVGSNVFVNSADSNTYITTNFASMYRQVDGKHLWYTAASGAAGASITFTNPMSLTADGNLGIGTTSPGPFRLMVSSTGATLAGTAKFVGVFNDATASSKGVGLGYDTSSQTGILYAETGSAASNLAFWTYTGSAWGERARIDSSGNLLVASTNSSMTTGTGIKLTAAGGGASTPTLGLVGNSSDNGQGSYHLYSSSLSQYQFYVSYGGTIFARSTSITGLSDISEKENIRDLETGLNSVLALQPRRFDWKNGSGSNVSGFIAQEVQSVLPDLVESYKISDEENKLGLKMGDMIPTLVKAIQEQQALITTLTERITALEGV